MRLVKGILSVIGGCILISSLGIFFSWANFSPYAISYIRLYSSPNDVDYSSVLWIPSLIAVGFSLTMYIAGVLENKIGTRAVTAIGSTICSLSLLLSAFSIKVNYFLFCTTFGFLFGIGYGFIYTPPLTLVMKWFPNYQTTMAAIVLLGPTTGGLLFNQIEDAYANPTNIKADQVTSLNVTDSDRYFEDEKILEKIPSLLMVMAGVCTAMQLTGITLLFPPPQNEGEKPDIKKSHEKESLLSSEQKSIESDSNDDEEPKQHLSSARHTINQAFGLEDSTKKASKEIDTAPTHRTKFWDLTIRQSVVQRPFIILWLLMLINSTTMNLVTGLYKGYGLNKVVNDDRFLTLVGSTALLFTAPAKVAMGLLSDKLSNRLVTLLCFGFQSLLYTTLFLPQTFANEAGRELLMLWTCLSFMVSASAFPLVLSGVAKIFGLENSTTLVGIMFSAEAFAGLPTILVSVFLLPRIGYIGIFVLCGIFSAAAVALTLLLDVKTSDGKYV
ncbi:monocarboxylate transporter 7-like [Watersipora subatra]|uniref:monocarboxylate transporter 7-like n=1 Tax=Watersipora subatra TaxID=2589382 RepID=UPI00355AF20B